MPMRIDETVRAVVTGAGSGLGRAFCQELLARGARVVASDLVMARAQQTAAGHDRCVALRCDVTAPTEVDAMAAEAERLFGGVDLLVNNAGVAVSGRMDEVPLEDWRWLFEINVFGVVNGLRSFLPGMRKRGRGHVINVASAAGLLCLPVLGPYNASKAAVVSISETLHGELQESGVGVTVLCPTFFRTNISEAGRGPAWVQAMTKALSQRDRLGAEGVARAALEAAERGQLHVVPHPDGLKAWRMKRLAPQWFAAQGKKTLRMITRRLGIVADV